MNIAHDYISSAPNSTGVSKEFSTAYAALVHGDANPMRQHLGLPLKGDCEDCGGEYMLVPHDKNLICLACYAERHAFMDSIYNKECR